jgi:hypothetical protein
LTLKKVNNRDNPLSKKLDDILETFDIFDCEDSDGIDIEYFKDLLKEGGMNNYQSWKTAIYIARKERKIFTLPLIALHNILVDSEERAISCIT